ncbi:MAG: hypothetical protein AAF968_05255 [Pseudomonadota bacterium]
MIVGSLTVTDRAVETHRDSYLLAHITVVSVRRPLLAPCCLLALGFGGFTLSFADLLYPGEILSLGLAAVTSLLFGVGLGQLQFLSRDLRGTDLSTAILGTYGHLNRLRREISAAMRRSGSQP